MTYLERERQRLEAKVEALASTNTELRAALETLRRLAMRLHLAANPNMWPIADDIDKALAATASVETKPEPSTEE